MSTATASAQDTSGRLRAGRAVDVVVVSFNSRDRLRACVEPLATLDGVHVVVADNASTDGSLDALSGLPIDAISLPRNGGFAYGCNAGWRAGDAPFVLLLNPDARIDGLPLERMVDVMEADEQLGAIGPLTLTAGGSLDLSQRRFPRLRSTYAQALFLHRLFPRSTWSGEVVSDPRAYEYPGSPDWLVGACVLVRRTALESIGGLDERFFLYREDIDLCRRLRQNGWGIRFEPTAVAVHEGGASAPWPTLLPVFAESRLLYARKHGSRPVAFLERLGIALHELTHSIVASGGADVRKGHTRALWLALSAPTKGDSRMRRDAPP